MQTRRHKPCDVRDVYHEIGADFIGDLAQAREIDDARIRRRARHDHSRLILDGEPFQLGVIDALVLFGNAVRHDLKIFARNVDGRTVRQVSAVGKVHAQNGIAGVEQGKIHGGIRLRAAVRLYVGMIAPEQLFATLDREIFHDVDILTAAVIAFAGQTLCIFVGEVGTHRRHHRGRHEVLAGDEFYVVSLAPEFEIHCFEYFGIGFFDCRKIDHDIFSDVILFYPIIITQNFFFFKKNARRRANNFARRRRTYS